jgi:hypothetical protein
MSSSLFSSVRLFYGEFHFGAGIGPGTAELPGRAEDGAAGGALFDTPGMAKLGY